MTTFRQTESLRVWIISATLAAFALSAILPQAMENKSARWGFALVLLALGGVGAFFYARQSDQIRSEIESNCFDAQQECELLRARGADAHERVRRLEAELRLATEERTRIEKRLTEEITKTVEKIEELTAQISTANAVIEEVRAQRAAVEAELGESQQRRSALESVNVDITAQLETTSHERAAARERVKELEIERNRQEQAIRDLTRDSEAARSEVSKLARQLDNMRLERDTIVIQHARSNSDLTDAKGRAANAELEAKAWRQQTGASDEIAARNSEIGRLLEEMKLLDSERNTERELRKTLESEINVLKDQYCLMEGRASEGDRLLEDLRRSLAGAKAESMQAKAGHFTFRLNHFDSKAVTLNFVNMGLPIELSSSACDGGVSCELPTLRRLNRGAETAIRLGAAKQLPKEFLLRVRYTAWPEEAVFRIRPFDAAKIEMVTNENPV